MQVTEALAALVSFGRSLFPKVVPTAVMGVGDVQLRIGARAHLARRSQDLGLERIYQGHGHLHSGER